MFIFFPPYSSSYFLFFLQISSKWYRSFKSDSQIGKTNKKSINKVFFPCFYLTMSSYTQPFLQICKSGECVRHSSPPPSPSPSPTPPPRPSSGVWSDWKPMGECQSECLVKSRGYQTMRRVCKGAEPNSCTGRDEENVLCKDEKVNWGCGTWQLFCTRDVFEGDISYFSTWFLQKSKQDLGNITDLIVKINIYNKRTRTWL